ncbi:hypothetical protein [Yinghuangia seranimata]|uniref:hypothetical protein n=1 Tax=Yinghuangia seranimata TaxID=408067 RepID=UPI00248CD124|nr:hypothetical protein [Yinghuangia seranimata]MDI2126845.1 hypothetical protein [Yinghuangia seranimata]
MANPGTTVAGITIAALIGVGALAWQAADTAPKDRRAGITASESPSPSGSGGPAPTAPATPPPPSVPANSGTGLRVVYSVGQNHVWLVDANNGVPREYAVAPGTVLTPVGQYRVQRKAPGPQTGGDGLKIVNTVVFGTSNGMTLGFSGTDTPLADILAANAPATPSGSPSGTATGGTRKPTGTATKSPTSTKAKNAGVREAVDTSKAMYEFVDIGTLVVVVP